MEPISLFFFLLIALPLLMLLVLTAVYLLILLVLSLIKLVTCMFFRGWVRIICTFAWVLIRVLVILHLVYLFASLKIHLRRPNILYFMFASPKLNFVHWSLNFFFNCFLFDFVCFFVEFTDDYFVYKYTLHEILYGHFVM